MKRIVFIFHIKLEKVKHQIKFWCFYIGKGEDYGRRIYKGRYPVFKI